MFKRFGLTIFFVLLCSSVATGEWDSDQASKIKTNTDNFGTNIPATDTDVQKALDTIDDLVLGGGSSDPDALDGDTVDDNLVDVAIIPTAAPSNGDTTHLSTADQIYDYLIANYVYTGGDAITITANDIDFDGGASPGGELGGTWASPTIDDLFLKLGGDTTTGDYDFTAGNLTTTGTGTIGTINFGSATGVSTTGANGVLTLTGLGTGGNNEALTLDLDYVSNQIVIGTTSGISRIWSQIGIAITDDRGLELGTGIDATLKWRDTSKDFLELNLACGSDTQTGYFNIIEQADTGNVNRTPSASTTNPTLRIYSADATEANDYIEFYHDQTDAQITVGGGNLKLNATNVHIGNGATAAGILAINEDTSDGTNFASFTVPALAANTVYTLPPDDGDAGEQLQTDGAGGLTWEAAGGAGATAYDDIGDPDAATTIAFADTETITYSCASDGETFFTIDDTDADLAGATTLLKLSYVDDSDADGNYLECVDDSGATPDSVFKIGPDGATTCGTLSAGIITTTGNAKGLPLHIYKTIIDPLSVQTEDNEICLVPAIDAAITITKIEITLDANANEVAGDLKYADTFIGLATPVVINDFDTTSGVRSDSSITSGAVAAGKCIYLSFDSAPNTAIHQMCIDITYDYD